MIAFIGTTELFILPIIALWLWSLIHCVMNKNIDNTIKIIGVILILALNILGSIIYLILPRVKKNENI